jgi:hypothetical protein
VKTHVDPFPISVQLRIGGHVDRIVKLPAVTVLGEELDRAAATRANRVERAGEISVPLEHIVSTGVQDKEIVPVKFEEVRSVVLG